MPQWHAWCHSLVTLEKERLSQNETMKSADTAETFLLNVLKNVASIQDRLCVQGGSDEVMMFGSLCELYLNECQVTSCRSRSQTFEVLFLRLAEVEALARSRDSSELCKECDVFVKSSTNRMDHLTCLGPQYQPQLVQNNISRTERGQLIHSNSATVKDL